MFRSIRAFSDGIYFHRKGIRLAFRHKSFLLLSLIPFAVSVALYGVAFYLFTMYADTLLDSIWHVGPQPGSEVIGWLHWAFMHLVKYVLYIIILILMFYTFIVFANIVGSPVYDYISERYRRIYHTADMEDRAHRTRSWLRIAFEEVKKAFLILFIPLVLFFIPAVGTVLSLIVAPVFIAWDFIDFSLAKDHVLLKERLTVVWENKFYFLGFGIPLLIPIFGIFLMPFAALGGAVLYFEKIRRSAKR